eukprot:IDg5721t1
MRAPQLGMCSYHKRRAAASAPPDLPSPAREGAAAHTSRAYAVALALAHCSVLVERVRARAGNDAPLAKALLELSKLVRTDKGSLQASVRAVTDALPVNVDDSAADIASRCLHSSTQRMLSAATAKMEEQCR